MLARGCCTVPTYSRDILDRDELPNDVGSREQILNGVEHLSYRERSDPTYYRRH